MKLKIMTYNIASGRCYAKDEDVNAQGGSIVDLDACAQVIREISPDLCGLNEINQYLPDFPARMSYYNTATDQTGYLTQVTGL